MQEEYLTALLGIQGVRVTRVKLETRGKRTAAIIYLDRPTPGYVCGRCQQPVAAAYESREQEVQHFTLWEHLTFLRFRRVRVACPTCGVVTEALPFVARYARITPGLAYLVAELCKVMTHPVRSVRERPRTSHTPRIVRDPSGGQRLAGAAPGNGQDH